MKLKDSKTMENLARSFAGECQAHIRYKFIAYGARQQGYIALADLIDKIVKQEFNHARMFYTKLQNHNKEQIDDICITGGYPFKEKWDLFDNLRLAAEDESNEELRTYPEFMEIAKQEGFDDIALLYSHVINVEKAHKEMFKEIYNQMKNDTLYKRNQKTTWVCSGCGHYDELKEAWQKCPLCDAEQGAVCLKLESLCSC